jgi:hypothetical protein
MVSVRSGLPRDALVGETEIWGPGGPGVTLKKIGFDFTGGTDPLRFPVSTNTWALTGLLNKAAGTTAASIELLTKVVDKTLSLPFTSQTA